MDSYFCKVGISLIVRHVNLLLTDSKRLQEYNLKPESAFETLEFTAERQFDTKDNRIKSYAKYGGAKLRRLSGHIHEVNRSAGAFGREVANQVANFAKNSESNVSKDILAYQTTASEDTAGAYTETQSKDGLQDENQGSPLESRRNDGGGDRNYEKNTGREPPQCARGRKSAFPVKRDSFDGDFSSRLKLPQYLRDWVAAYRSYLATLPYHDGEPFHQCFVDTAISLLRVEVVNLWSFLVPASHLNDPSSRLSSGKVSEGDQSCSESTVLPENEYIKSSSNSSAHVQKKIDSLEEDKTAFILVPLSKFAKLMQNCAYRFYFTVSLIVDTLIALHFGEDFDFSRERNAQGPLDDTWLSQHWPHRIHQYNGFKQPICKNLDIANRNLPESYQFTLLYHTLCSQVCALMESYFPKWGDKVLHDFFTVMLKSYCRSIIPEVFGIIEIVTHEAFGSPSGTPITAFREAKTIRSTVLHDKGQPMNSHGLFSDWLTPNQEEPNSSKALKSRADQAKKASNQGHCNDPPKLHEDYFREDSRCKSRRDRETAFAAAAAVNNKSSTVKRNEHPVLVEEVELSSSDSSSFSVKLLLKRADYSYLNSLLPWKKAGFCSPEDMLEIKSPILSKLCASFSQGRFTAEEPIPWMLKALLLASYDSLDEISHELIHANSRNSENARFLYEKNLREVIKRLGNWTTKDPSRSTNFKIPRGKGADYPQLSGHEEDDSAIGVGSDSPKSYAFLPSSYSKHVIGAFHAIPASLRDSGITPQGSSSSETHTIPSYLKKHDLIEPCNDSLLMLKLLCELTERSFLPADVISSSRKQPTLDGGSRESTTGSPSALLNKSQSAYLPNSIIQPGGRYYDDAAASENSILIAHYTSPNLQVDKGSYRFDQHWLNRIFKTHGEYGSSSLNVSYHPITSQQKYNEPELNTKEKLSCNSISSCGDEQQKFHRKNLLLSCYRMENEASTHASSFIPNTTTDDDFLKEIIENFSLTNDSYDEDNLRILIYDDGEPCNLEQREEILWYLYGSAFPPGQVFEALDVTIVPHQLEFLPVLCDIFSSLNFASVWENCLKAVINLKLTKILDGNFEFILDFPKLPHTIYSLLASIIFPFMRVCLGLGRALCMPLNAKREFKDWKISEEIVKPSFSCNSREEATAKIFFHDAGKRLEAIPSPPHYYSQLSGGNKQGIFFAASSTIGCEDSAIYSEPAQLLLNTFSPDNAEISTSLQVDGNIPSHLVLACNRANLTAIDSKFEAFCEDILRRCHVQVIDLIAPKLLRLLLDYSNVTPCNFPTSFDSFLRYSYNITDSNSMASHVTSKRMSASLIYRLPSLLPRETLSTFELIHLCLKIIVILTQLNVDFDSAINALSSFKKALSERKDFNFTFFCNVSKFKAQEMQLIKYLRYQDALRGYENLFQYPTINHDFISFMLEMQTQETTAGFPPDPIEIKWKQRAVGSVDNLHFFTKRVTAGNHYHDSEKGFFCFFRDIICGTKDPTTEIGIHLAGVYLSRKWFFNALYAIWDTIASWTEKMMSMPARAGGCDCYLGDFPWSRCLVNLDKQTFGVRIHPLMLRIRSVCDDVASSNELHNAIIEKTNLSYFWRTLRTHYSSFNDCLDYFTQECLSGPKIILQDMLETCSLALSENGSFPKLPIYVLLTVCSKQYWPVNFMLGDTCWNDAHFPDPLSTILDEISRKDGVLKNSWYLEKTLNFCFTHCTVYLENTDGTFITLPFLEASILLTLDIILTSCESSDENDETGVTANYNSGQNKELIVEYTSVVGCSIQELAEELRIPAKKLEPHLHSLVKKGHVQYRENSDGVTLYSLPAEPPNPRDEFFTGSDESKLFVDAFSHSSELLAIQNFSAESLRYFGSSAAFSDIFNRETWSQDISNSYSLDSDSALPSLDTFERTKSMKIPEWFCQYGEQLNDEEAGNFGASQPDAELQSVQSVLGANVNAKVVTIERLVMNIMYERADTTLAYEKTNSFHQTTPAGFILLRLNEELKKRQLDPISFPDLLQILAHMKSKDLLVDRGGNWEMPKFFI